jgi:hypothetical protein
MSWRTQVRALQAIGGRGTAVEIDPTEDWWQNRYRHLCRARTLRLVTSTGKRGGGQKGTHGAPMAVWSLTPLGAAWAAGIVSDGEVLRQHALRYLGLSERGMPRCTTQECKQ